MKCLGRAIAVVLLALVVVSCSTTKVSKKADFIGGLTEMEYWENAISNHDEIGKEGLTAKMSLALDISGKTIKVSGTMRVKKGEVVQLSVAPLLGIEVARAEISPNGVLVIDRMNKRYVRVSFDELQELTNAQLDFYSLQALFLNEIFSPVLSPCIFFSVSGCKSAPTCKGNKVYLATDPDREGEAIAYHLANQLDLDLEGLNRIEFNEITKDAINKGLDNPRGIDLNLVKTYSHKDIEKMAKNKVKTSFSAIFYAKKSL